LFYYCVWNVYSFFFPVCVQSSLYSWF
jgi:hypothetical protein